MSQLGIKLHTLLRIKSFLINFMVFAVIFALFLLNSLHESYPDEFDNILGGWYIIHGRLPYTGFFTHHGPIPYFIAAVITLVSGQSFVAFRILYAILLFSFAVWSFIYLRKKLGASETKFYPAFLLLLGFLSTYYWTHMLLADNVAAILLTPVYAFLFIKSIYGQKPELADFKFISILSSLALYSSLTYSYFYVIVILFSLYLYLKQFPRTLRRLFLEALKPVGWILLPHLVILLYLLISGGLSDYLYQNFRFNAQYYIYNYPRPEGASFINPIRFAVIIANNFFNGFHTLIIGIKDFSFGIPINTTMAVANTAVAIVAIIKKRYSLFAFIALALIYSNARSDVLASRETDYQSAVYILISFFNLFYVLPTLFSNLNQTKVEFGKKVIYSLLLLLCSVYGFFCLMFIIRKFDEKFYRKYMGTSPLIYNRPKIAPLINLVADKNDYAWIGPFEFEELLYMNAKIPSKHHILIKGVAQSEKLNSKMISDFSQNKPKVIYFDKNFHYLGSKTEDYSGKFISFLKKYYITINQYESSGKKYDFIDANVKVDFRSHLYMRKDKASEIIPVLLKNNYIQEK